MPYFQAMVVDPFTLFIEYRPRAIDILDHQPLSFDSVDVVPLNSFVYKRIV